MTGTIIIKYMNISEHLKDYQVIEIEKLKDIELKEYILGPKEIKGYENIPQPEPIERNSRPCDTEWEPDKKAPIPFGYQRVILTELEPTRIVEFFYKAVIK